MICHTLFLILCLEDDGLSRFVILGKIADGLDNETDDGVGVPERGEVVQHDTQT